MGRVQSASGGLVDFVLLSRAEFRQERGVPHAGLIECLYRHGMRKCGGDGCGCQHASCPALGERPEASKGDRFIARARGSSRREGQEAHIHDQRALRGLVGRGVAVATDDAVLSVDKSADRGGLALETNTTGRRLRNPSVNLAWIAELALGIRFLAVGGGRADRTPVAASTQPIHPTR